MADKTTKTDPGEAPNGEAAGDNTTHVAETKAASEAETGPVYRILDPGGVEWRDPVTQRPKFARAGARRSDIPRLSIPWLVRGGHIELVETGEDADPGEDEGGA